VFAVAVSVAAGTIFGLAPAWLMSGVDLIGTLRQEGRGSKGSPGRSRARQILVISELALSLVLMVAAGLLLRSFWDLFQVQPGFNPERVMAIQTWLPGPNDPTKDPYQTAAQESVLLREILRRSRNLRGVEEAAIGDEAAIPLGHSSPGRLPLLREGIETMDNQAPVIDSPIVSPEYFHLLGMPLERGRLFSDQDLENTPQVAVINQAAARTYWPGRDPLGQHISFDSGDSGSPTWLTVVGVAKNAKQEDWATPPFPEAYLAAFQNRDFLGQPGAHGEAMLHMAYITLVVRTTRDPGALVSTVKNTVWSLDRNLPISEVLTMDTVVADANAQPRFEMLLLGIFAVVALVMAAVGIYGVMSYSVSRRTHEIGIRISLGASRSEVFRLVVRQGMVLALVGSAAGIAGALLLSRLMVKVLYGVRPIDPITFAGVTLLLTIVAMAASYIPSRRAMQVDPIAALRHE